MARGRRRAAGVLEVRTVVLGSRQDPPRVAYGVGRSVGNAVVRNRVRRRLRVAVRENADLLQRGSGYLVRAKSGAGSISMNELNTTMRAILAGVSGESA